MHSELMKSNLDYFYKAILNLKTEDECRRFFADLCTIPELKALTQRLHVAHMLDEGHIYTDIVKETGASTAIVSRVKRSMIYGEDGYKTVFERMKND